MSFPYIFNDFEVIVMYESNFQKKLKKEIKERFPGCIVYKLDPQQLQGSPDLLVLYEDKWGALEVKKDRKASHRPNQDLRVKQMNEMSFASFIFPENKEEVLNDMERLFKA